MGKRNLYNVSDSKNVFLWALLLPQVVSLVIAMIFSFIYKTQEAMTSSLAYLFVSVVLAQACFAFIFYYYNKRNNINFKQATKLNFKCNFKNVAVCVCISIVAVFGFSNFINNISNLFAKIGFNSPEAALPINTFYWFLINVVLLAFIPAIMEELIFRGMIFNGLRKKGFKIAAIISAVMFAIIHLSIKQFVFPIIMGVVFSFVLEKTGSLVYTMIVHFCNNFFVLLISYITKVTNKNFIEINFTNSYFLTIFLSIIIAIIASLLIYLLIKFVLSNNQKETIGMDIQNENDAFVVNDVVNIQKDKIDLTTSLIIGAVLWIVYVLCSLFA